MPKVPSSVYKPVGVAGSLVYWSLGAGTFDAASSFFVFYASKTSKWLDFWHIGHMSTYVEECMLQS